MVEDETDELLQDDKKNLILLTLNASACANLNKYQKAEKVFQIGLSNYPKSEDLNNNYLNLLIKKNDFEKAIEIAEKAVNAGVTNSNILNGLGLAYSNLNKIDNAIEYFKKSLKLTHPISMLHIIWPIVYEPKSNSKRPKNITMMH